MRWEPEFFSPSTDFKILLDGEYGKRLHDQRINVYIQKRLNELATEQLKKLNTHWPSPLHFYEDSLLVDQLTLGSGGRWLSASIQYQDFRRPIEYSSHNIDSTKDAYILLTLFDCWIKYAHVNLQK